VIGGHPAWPWALLVLWPAVPLVAVLAWRWTSRDARILRARRREQRRRERAAARRSDEQARLHRRGVAP
jgi:hypothetical protein